MSFSTVNLGNYRLLSSNRLCFALVCRPLRLKSSASSATVTSSSFTAQSSRLPTMESLLVRRLSRATRLTVTAGSRSEMASDESARPTSQFVLAVNGAEVSMDGVGECQTLQEGSALMQSLCLCAGLGRIKRMYRSAGAPDPSVQSSTGYEWNAGDFRLSMLSSPCVTQGLQG